MRERHAVFATTIRPDGSHGPTFRIGQPVDWDRAMRRWYRLDDRRLGVNRPPRPITVRHDGRRYRAAFFEVRAVDRDGRGLGSERHHLALTSPYRAVRSALRYPTRR